jgi:hypothetical protein
MRPLLPVAAFGTLLVAGTLALASVTTLDAPVLFESPSGNIRCLIAQGSGKASARCVTLQPRQAAQVVDGQRARQLPFGRVGPLEAAEALPYGESVLSAGFLRNSKKVGVACVDVSTNRGFRVAREGIAIFPRPQQPPPAPSAPSTPAPLVSPQGACDPNYQGACVPPAPPDLDCSDIGTTVRVVGSDPHRLDADGDGYGCESY